MRSRHPIFAAAMMLIAGIARPAKDSSGVQVYTKGYKQVHKTAAKKTKTASRTLGAYDRRIKGWGSPSKHVRFNFPHPPTTAELSKSRSMHRKWMKAAVKYPGSPAAIALQSDVASAVARALTQFGSPA